MGKKKEVEIPKPLITRHCEICGEWFIAKHPKDDETKCERCRKSDKGTETKGDAYSVSLWGKIANA